MYLCFHSFGVLVFLLLSRKGASTRERERIRFLLHDGRPFFPLPLLSSCSFSKPPPLDHVFRLKLVALRHLKSKKKLKKKIPTKQARSAPSCSTRPTRCSPRPGSRSSSPRSGKRFPREEGKLLRRRFRRRRRRRRSCSACWSRRRCPPRSPGWLPCGSGRASPRSAKEEEEEEEEEEERERGLLLLDSKRPTLFFLLLLLLASRRS